MENAKHTPGPWEAVSNLVRTAINEDRTGGYLVAECPANIGNRIEDARLIAAAPDLLAALVAFRDGGPQGGRNFAEWHESYKPAIDLARAAIAKATGEAI